MAPGGTHPRYSWWRFRDGLHPVPVVLIGDEVADQVGAESGVMAGMPLGVVTDIHGETFGDGTGDTITVIPAAVTLSTGDRYPVADLVLLRRAES